MNLALWTVTGPLAVVFMVAAVDELMLPKEKLARAPGGAWVEDFSSGVLKTIGALEIVGVEGLILPALLDIAPVLAPLASRSAAPSSRCLLLPQKRRPSDRTKCRSARER